MGILCVRICLYCDISIEFLTLAEMVAVLEDVAVQLA